CSSDFRLARSSSLVSPSIRCQFRFSPSTYLSSSKPSRSPFTWGWSRTLRPSMTITTSRVPRFWAGPIPSPSIAARVRKSMWQNVFVIWSGQTIPKNAGSLDSCKFTHDCVSSDGTAPHYRLQRRKGKEARLVALVVTSDSVYQMPPPILHIDNNYGPYRECHLAIGKFHGTAQSKLFFPIVSFGIPNHSPKSFEGLRVKIDNLPRIAVIWILRRNLKTIGLDDFPIFF